MKFKLVKIEGALFNDHWYLDRKNDRCFFFCEYYPGKGFGASDCNSLISNFKKPPDRKGLPEYEYKLGAIARIAQMIEQSIPEHATEDCTFVPIPPSKAKSDENHDDRGSRVLEIVRNNKGIDFRELLFFKESHKPYHTSTERRSPEALKALMQIDESCLVQPLKNTVVLFDDVLTTGAHFKACKELFIERVPGISVIGLFVARTKREAGQNV